LTDEDRTVIRITKVLAKEAPLSETAISAQPGWVKEELAVGRHYQPVGRVAKEAPPGIRMGGYGTTNGTYSSGGERKSRF